MPEEEFIQGIDQPPMNLDNIEHTTNAFSTAVQVTRRSSEVAMVGIEISPINEAIRFGVMGAAIAKGIAPEAVAAVTGAATLAVESGGALAAAGLLTSDKGSRAVNWINNKLHNNLKISPEARFSTPTKAGIAFLGGSAIVAAVQYREQPEMSEAETRVYGLKSAAMLAGSSAIMGYGASKGFELPIPELAGAGLIAVGALIGIGSRIKKRIRGEQIAEGIDVDNIEKLEEDKNED